MRRRSCTLTNIENALASGIFVGISLSEYHQIWTNVCTIREIRTPRGKATIVFLFSVLPIYLRAGALWLAERLPQVFRPLLPLPSMSPVPARWGKIQTNIPNRYKVKKRAVPVLHFNRDCFVGKLGGVSRHSSNSTPCCAFLFLICSQGSREVG